MPAKNNIDGPLYLRRVSEDNKQNVKRNVLSIIVRYPVLRNIIRNSSHRCNTLCTFVVYE